MSSSDHCIALLFEPTENDWRADLRIDGSMMIEFGQRDHSFDWNTSSWHIDVSLQTA